ncbi:MAG: sulfotransferase [Cytophagales bacterium]|nr:sulfotransferase [Cytophagales bacterium]
MDKIIAIGGQGGSGTRLISSILSESDIYWGECFNNAFDNLVFIALFRSLPSDVTFELFEDHFQIFKGYMVGRGLTSVQSEYIDEYLSDYTNKNVLKAKKYLTALKNNDNSKRTAWGWKEPNTHIFLPQLFHCQPGLKYIHVMRHGLDMAFSLNQNQAKRWGEALTGKPCRYSPNYQLHYWVCVHQRIQKLQKMHPTNIHVLNFDQLCIEKEEPLGELLTFLDLDIHDFDKVVNSISPPPSLGRHKQYNLEQFDIENIEYVIKMGFDV